MTLRNNHIAKGFTLLELMVTVAVIGILATIGVPAYRDYTIRAKVSEALIMASVAKIAVVESASMGGLDRIKDGADLVQVGETHYVKRIESVDKGIIELETHNTGALENQHPILALIPTMAGGAIAWDCEIRQGLPQQVPSNCRDGIYTVTLNHGLRFGDGWSASFLSGSYSGDKKNIMIPTSIDGKGITQIYQDVFNGKGLTSVSFQNGSIIERIHARAFQNNQLTKIMLPETLNRIDWGAFNGNKITSVTIPGNVTMEGNAINESNAFRDAYTAVNGGAGTYLLIEGRWVRQQD